jgi:hypothetical protein
MFIPEKDLLIAVLDRAALDFHSNNPSLKEIAREWIFDGKAVNHSFSYEWVCNHLNLESDLLRSKILELNLDSSVSQRQRWLRRKVRNAETREVFEQQAA